ncbi:MAG: 2-oxo acid dehydrogenase subunit E2 [Kiritimatiellae bacterium]|nr:2-oxo acid dehydrogenase subunit E2 [Kiritimatiellia bacterium]
MKTIPILMPQMGQSVAEGTITKWCKQVGDSVAADEVLMEVESDKITVEVESPVAGRLAAIMKGEGARAKIGEVVATLETEGSAGASAEAATQEPPKETRANQPHASARGEQVMVSVMNEGDDNGSGSRLPELTRDWLSPFVLRLAMINNISLKELQEIRGSGQSGRVTKNDLLQYLAHRPVGATNLAQVTGKPAPTPRDIERLGQVVPMTSIRRTIADHMVQSIHTSAHVTMVHAVDMTHIVALRDRIKAAFEQRYGVKMTYTAVMIYVTARVLRDFPTINASVLGENLVLRKEVNIGCAVALQDESLVVPVVKNADRLSFPEIAQELDRLIRAARSKQLTRSDVEGGTFSMSNFGAFGSLLGTPIIYQPQVAILGMGAIFEAPAVVNHKVEVRSQLYLSFSFDHRVIDGAMGGRFLNAIQTRTESLEEKDLGCEKL